MRTSLRRTVLAACAALTLAVPTAVATRHSAAAPGSIPAPEQYFGFKLGSDGHLATFDKMDKYFRLVADKSDRVTYQQIGKTTLGNPYSMLTISSKKNLANLDKLMAINDRLADPRGLSPTEAQKLARQGKPFYYIQAGIHSTEVGNSQAMVEIAHRLATEHSTFVDDILDDAVILMVPSQNPDGTKLVNDYFAKTAGTNYARTYPDLYQKYVGHDDNRDWFMFTQAESRLMVSIQNRFHPQVFQDAHQAGSTAPRMFTPPYLSPSDPNIDPITVQQTNALGMTMQRGMTAAGMKGTGWGMRYDYWTPSRQYQVYHGAVRMLTEAASVKDLAYPYKSDDGKPLGQQEPDTNFIQPYDSDTWRLRQILDYTEQAFYSAVDSVAKDGYNWLYNFYRVGRNAVERTSPYAYVLSADQRDPQALFDLLTVLHTGAVEIGRANAAFTAGGKQYPAGSYVISMRQPYAAFAKTLLEVQHYPQLLQYPGGPPQQPYDVTAQTLPMLLGVSADKVDDAFSVATTPVDEVRPLPVTMPDPPAEGGAYVVGPESYGVFSLVSQLQKQNVATFRAGASFTSAGHTFAPGTFVIQPTDAARTVLQAAATRTGIPVYAVDEVPSLEGVELKPGTRIGLLKPPNNIPSGWLMWMFDQYKVNYEVVRAQDYADLSGRFDAILMPSGVSKSDIVEGLDATRYPPEWSWAYGVGEKGWQALHDFVTNGGTLVSYGSGTDTAEELLDLPLKTVLPDDDTKFYCPGSLLSQQIDPSNPVGWGMNPENPVWFDGDDAFEITGDAYKYEVAGRYPSSGEELQSGWLIGGDYLKGAANTVSWQVGKGYVVTFGNQSAFRTWNRAEQKMIFNALYYGPAQKVTPSTFSKLGD